MLTLVLNTTGAQVYTDSIQVLDLNESDLPPLYNGRVRRLPNNRICKVEIDLLRDGFADHSGTVPVAQIIGGYSLDPLLARLHNKQLKMQYEDDAVVVVAILELAK